METTSIKGRLSDHGATTIGGDKLILTRIWLKQKWIKLTSWEYWPIKVVYFIPSIYFLYISIRERSLLFFTASNPGIETGGMFFESKWSIFKKLPKHLYPTTVFISENDSINDLLTKLGSSDIKFPLIAKPDRGERGWGVKLIHDSDDLALYQKLNTVDFLIQQYIDYPVELSVFYYRKPGEAHGSITSLTGKELLSVTGDGVSSVKSLILKSDRALMQFKNLIAALGNAVNDILPLGEVRILVPYGNHCRGAMFIDLCASITPELIKVFDDIGKDIDGFYFGRFDVRCKSLIDLAMGRIFYILELNGAGAEPAHIYHPGFSFFKGQKVLIGHFKTMHEAGKINHARGVPYMPYGEFRKLWAAKKANCSKVTWL